jgi:hypothetical protein
MTRRRKGVLLAACLVLAVAVVGLWLTGRKSTDVVITWREVNRVRVGMTPSQVSAVLGFAPEPLFDLHTEGNWQVWESKYLVTSVLFDQDERVLAVEAFPRRKPTRLEQFRQYLLW